MPSSTENNNQLFHVKETIVDRKNETMGSISTTNVVESFTDLDTAKACSRTVLKHLGITPSRFTDFGENIGQVDWPFEDGTMAYAQAVGGQEIYVSIDTKENTSKLLSNDEGRVIGPLYYVLQSFTDYDLDSFGSSHHTEIEGTFRDREDAVKFAHKVLLDEDINQNDFATYEENKNQDDWPYGEDSIVHAASATGKIYTISVLSPVPREVGV
jgi:hypothetical protein